MNIQSLKKRAQEMKKDLQKVQKELSNSSYVCKSSCVEITLNGDKKMQSIKINLEEEISGDDIEMLEDMILVAYNEASKKVDDDKEKKLSKYGNGLAGMM